MLADWLKPERFRSGRFQWLTRADGRRINAWFKRHTAQRTDIYNPLTGEFLGAHFAEPRFPGTLITVGASRYVAHWMLSRVELDADEQRRLFEWLGEQTPSLIALPYWATQWLYQTGKLNPNEHSPSFDLWFLEDQHEYNRR